MAATDFASVLGYWLGHKSCNVVNTVPHNRIFLPPVGEMIDKLTITFNRTRQAVITGELIEIISGAAAL